MRVHQADSDLPEHRQRVVHVERPAAEQLLKRTPLHVIHHVVGRGRVPADGEELDDVAVGEQIAELFHLAGEQRPVEPAAAVEELDHHPATAVAVDSAPGLAEGPLAQERLLLVPGDVEWRLEPRHAQLAGEPELVRPHHQGRVTDVRHARHPDRWRRGGCGVPGPRRFRPATSPIIAPSAALLKAIPPGPGPSVVSTKKLGS